jgi:hypothetical protein
MDCCRLCGVSAIASWLDFGPQALTNRFPVTPDEPDYLHPCRLGVCGHCGTLQLETPVPLDEMRPRVDWISYNEPERHLDDFARVLARWPGLNADSTFGAITYKDDSTLERLRNLGFPKTWRADLIEDLGVSAPNSGIESVQAALNPETAQRLLARYGAPDVLLVRHVLEHSYNIHQLLDCVRKVVKPNGLIVFEMPDARRALERLDYSTVWEEHLFYFTPTTLRRVFALAGFDVLFLESYHYTLENSLMAIVRPASGPVPIPGSREASEEDLGRAERFLQEFPRVRKELQEILASYAQIRGPVTMLGAGHLSAAFINLYGLEKIVSFVIDDNPKKQGRYLPGSKVPILPASELVNRNAKLCLMSVRPEVEEVVVAKNQGFLKSGGVLASVFPDSRYAFAKLGGKS